MNVKPAAVEALLNRLDPRLGVLLFYGTDQGLITERVRRTLRAVVDDPNDPFRVTDADAEALASAPGRINEEAQTPSLLGGRRVVRVRQADGLEPRLAASLQKDLEALLKAPAIEALVLIEAADLKATAPLRRMCERADNAAALPCYRDERNLADAVRSDLRAAGLTVEPAALRYIETHLGADRELTRRELEKLALYMASADPPTVRLADVEAVIGDGTALEIDAFVWATLAGRFPAAKRALARLLAEKTAPVTLTRILGGTLNRLLPLALRVETGTPAAAAVDAARPPVFWKQKPAWAQALGQWKAPALMRAIAATAATERRLKQTGMPDALVLERLVLEVCGMIKTRN